MEPQKFTGWVARNSKEYQNTLYLFSGDTPPSRMMTYWLGCFAWDSMEMPNELFPNLKWEDEPLKVQITLDRIIDKED